MTDDQKCMAPPLSEKQLYWIRIMAETNFTSMHWNLPNVRRMLLDLLNQIQHLEDELKKLKDKNT